LLFFPPFQVACTNIYNSAACILSSKLLQTPKTEIKQELGATMRSLLGAETAAQLKPTFHISASTWG
jgi:hypothetical protein